MIEQALKYIPIFGPPILFVVWLVRLEAKALQNERDLKRHEKIVEANNLTVWNKIDASYSTNVEIFKSLTEIKTKLDIYEKWMRKEQ